MTQLKMTIEEFFNFKAIAKFIFMYSVSNGLIVVEADTNELAALGYC